MLDYKRVVRLEKKVKIMSNKTKSNKFSCPVEAIQQSSRSKAQSLNDELYKAVQANDRKRMVYWIQCGAQVCPSKAYAIDLLGTHLWSKLWHR